MGILQSLVGNGGGLSASASTYSIKITGNQGLSWPNYLEGETIAITLYTTYVTTGTVVTYTIQPYLGSNINASDFTDNTLSGTFTVSGTILSGIGSVSKTFAQNNTTWEGSEYFQVIISISGVQKAISDVVMVVDSMTQPNIQVTLTSPNNDLWMSQGSTTWRTTPGNSGGVTGTTFSVSASGIDKNSTGSMSLYVTGQYLGSTYNATLGTTTSGGTINYKGFVDPSYPLGGYPTPIPVLGVNGSINGLPTAATGSIDTNLTPALQSYNGYGLGGKLVALVETTNQPLIYSYISIYHPQGDPGYSFIDGITVNNNVKVGTGAMAQGFYLGWNPSTKIATWQISYSGWTGLLGGLSSGQSAKVLINFSNFYFPDPTGWNQTITLTGDVNAATGTFTITPRAGSVTIGPVTYNMAFYASDSKYTITTPSPIKITVYNTSLGVQTVNNISAPDVIAEYGAYGSGIWEPIIVQTANVIDGTYLYWYLVDLAGNPIRTTTTSINGTGFATNTAGIMTSEDVYPGVEYAGILTDPEGNGYDTVSSFTFITTAPIRIFNNKGIFVLKSDADVFTEGTESFKIKFTFTPPTVYTTSSGEITFTEDPSKVAGISSPISIIDNSISYRGGQLVTSSQWNTFMNQHAIWDPSITGSSAFERSYSLYFPADGTYVFQLNVDDNALVMLDGVTIVSAHDNYNSAPVSVSQTVTKGIHHLQFWAESYPPPSGIALIISQQSTGSIIFDTRSIGLYFTNGYPSSTTISCNFNPAGYAGGTIYGIALDGNTPSTQYWLAPIAAWTGPQWSQPGSYTSYNPMISITNNAIYGSFTGSNLLSFSQQTNSPFYFGTPVFSHFLGCYQTKYTYTDWWDGYSYVIVEPMYVYFSGDVRGSWWNSIQFGGQTFYRTGILVSFLGYAPYTGATSSSLGTFNLPTSGNTFGDGYILYDELWVWDGSSWVAQGIPWGTYVPDSSGGPGYTEFRLSNFAHDSSGTVTLTNTGSFKVNYTGGSAV